MAMVTLVETSDVAMLPLIKSVLEAAGVPFSVEGEESLGLFPLAGGGRLFTRRPVAARILVPAERLDEARALIDAGAPHDRAESEQEGGSR